MSSMRMREVAKTRTGDPIERLQELVALVDELHVLMLWATVKSVVVHLDYRTAGLGCKAPEAREVINPSPAHASDPVRDPVHAYHVIQCTLKQLIWLPPARIYGLRLHVARTTS
jgi:hypothetical protein